MFLSLATASYLAVAILIAAKHKPGYSHVKHTISELAECGSAHMASVSFGVFLPVAIALGIVAILLVSTSPQAAALALSIAVGYGIGAMFPCDPGSPLTGSFRQAIHNLGGATEYLGGAFSLFWISESAGPGFRIAGFVVAASAILLSVVGAVRGLVQRIAESCLFLALPATLWLL